MVLTVAINATGLQPEFFDVFCQSEIRLVPWQIWLLNRSVSLTRMNIQLLTEQTNKPTLGVVTDKGVPQPDSFAKYAAAFF